MPVVLAREYARFPLKAREDSFPVGRLYPFENHYYWFVEQLYFTKKLFGTVNCIVWHHPKCDEPIYLVSNLDYPKDIMDYYSKRFLI